MEGGRNVDRTVSRFIRYAECASESQMKRRLLNICRACGMGIPFERQELGNEVVTDGWGPGQNFGQVR